MLIAPSRPNVIELPCWRPLARHALRTTLMVSLLPMAVFYTTLAVLGIRMAVLATVAWFYAGLLPKLVRRKPVLAARVLAAGLLTFRAVIMFVTGSSFLYFLQPVAGTVVVALTFAASAVAGGPLLDRLAHEFCPVPEELSERLRATSFFAQLSVVWSMTYLVNALSTVWLLTNASLNGFVLVKSIMGPVLTSSAVLTSYLLFRATIRRHDIPIRWSKQPVPAC